jgi:hypothetical protein
MFGAMHHAKSKSNPDTIVIELDEYEARELANFLDQSDMHMSIGDRLSLARNIKRALKRL